MILQSEEGEFELSVVGVAPSVPGVWAGGDVQVAVRVRLRDFSGATDASVDRDVWSNFLRQLKELDRDRRGEAILSAFSPEELRVRFFALDRAGHLAVEGGLTSYFVSKHEPRAASLKFGAIEFDQGALPKFLRELEAATARTPP